MTFRWSLVRSAWGLPGEDVRHHRRLHRYFSHRPTRPAGPSSWSSPARRAVAAEGRALVGGAPPPNHRYSDRHGDIHLAGPAGLLQAHVGWCSTASTTHRVGPHRRLRALPRAGVARPLARFRRAARHRPSTPAGGAPALMWGFFFSTVLTWPRTSASNSLTPCLAGAAFAQGRQPSTAWCLALITLARMAQQPHYYRRRPSGLLLVGDRRQLLRAAATGRGGVGVGPPRAASGGGCRRRGEGWGAARPAGSGPPRGRSLGDWRRLNGNAPQDLLVKENRGAFFDLGRPTRRRTER